jgi:hypothetical protein
MSVLRYSVVPVSSLQPCGLTGQASRSEQSVAIVDG